MSGLQSESRAAIVQRDSCVSGDKAGAEAAEEGLNERHHVAVAVGGGEIDRVAAIDAGEIGRVSCRRPAHADISAA